MTANDSTMHRAWRWGAAAAAVIALAAAAWAVRAQADPVDLQVVDRDTGHVLRVWRHDGRLFVAGEPGDRYSLRVTNHTDRRILVVMSVDGVNVLTGQTANYDQDGYVFAPYQSYEVTGWRKSTSEVAAFTFAPLPDSYAARTGRPEEVGVIGVAVFDERAPIPPEAAAGVESRVDRPDEADGSSRVVVDAQRQQNSAGKVPVAISAFTGQSREVRAAPLAALAPPAPRAAPSDQLTEQERPRDEKLGTGHGEREASYVDLVDFERASPYPAFVRQIEYDTRANLVSAGVIPSWRYEPPHHPRPFPENDDGFVPDPPG